MTHAAYEEMAAEDVDWDLALRRMESDLERESAKRHAGK